MPGRFYPLKEGTYKIGSPYGPRSGGFHYGLDFEAKDGTAFYAVQDGTVQYIGPATGYGQWIVIDSDDSEGGGCVEYGHMWDAYATNLRVGSRVKAGQLIGFVGSNGESTGPHLHISVHKTGYTSEYVNPAVWLSGAGRLGQVTTAPKDIAMAAPAPIFRDIDLMGNNRNNRFGARVIYIFLHTEEGYSKAEQLVRSGNSSGNFSYHNIFDDNTRVAMVDTDFASWSVLDANPYSVSYCFAGSRASMSRQEWLTNFRNAIRIAAFTAAEDCRKYGYVGKVVNLRPYPKGRVPSIADHNYVTVILGIGTHTDVGVNFPKDVFEADFNLYMSGAPAPVIVPENKINKEAERAKAWIGARLDKEEQNCRGTAGGKFVRFQNGVIYWSPQTGAHAIPLALMETYKIYDYEVGKLGYPIGDHTVLKGGVVQGFQNGALYLKNGSSRGWMIFGRIRDRWNKDNFENGRWGYPISDEFTTQGGTKYQVFDNGRIIFTPDKFSTIGLVPADGPDEII